MKKCSCYVVELSVQPGGSRWAEIHVYSRPQAVQHVLETFCKDSWQAAYHGMSYGALLGIWTIQNGKVTAFLDLHDLLRVSHADFGEARMSDKARYQAFLDKVHKEENFDRFNEVKVTMDWDAIANALPPLNKPLLMSGDSLERVTLPKALKRKDSYLDPAEIVWGSNDQETGDELPDHDDEEGMDEE